MNIIKLLKNNNAAIIKKVSEIIKNDGIVILPFDTVYGYACNPKNDKALERIFELKRRDPKKTLGLAVSDIESFIRIAQISDNSIKYIQNKTPGKYTFVVKVNPELELSYYCIRNNTIGVRVPDSRFILDIIQASGGIIAQTSANKSGRPDPFSVDELFNQYSENELGKIDLIVDNGELEKSSPSKIIDLTGDKPREIDRN